MRIEKGALRDGEFLGGQNKEAEGTQGIVGLHMEQK